MQEETVKPTPSKWECPECKQRMTFYVMPSSPPTCANPEVHPKKSVKMEQKK
jgi:hypothetical protein